MTSIAVTVWATLWSAAPAQTPPPNFLVIVADDLGADQVGRFNWAGAPSGGLASTPHLDDLADTGLVFRNAWANPTCSPTRAALHTGNHAFQVSIGWALPALAPELPGPDPSHLPAALVELDYATGLFGKWHLGVEGSDTSDVWTDPGSKLGAPPPVYKAGYQAYDGFLDGGVSDYSSWERVYHDGSAWVVVDCDGVSGCVGDPIYVDEVVTQSAIAWIGDRTQPWLAVVALAAPHESTRSPQRYKDDDAGDDAHCAALYSPFQSLLACDTSAGSDIECPETTIYKALITCMDERIGDLLDGLEAGGDLANTLVFFVGDNGTPVPVITDPYDDPSGTHAYGKETVSHTGVHVPMIISDPSESGLIGTPREVTSPIHVMDVYATIRESAGDTMFDDNLFASDSLVPCLTGSSQDCASGDPTLYAEAFNCGTPPPASCTPPALLDGTATVLVNGKKMVATYHSAQACMYTDLVSPDVFAGLFDLPNDVHELQDLDSNIPMCFATRAAFDAILPTWMPSGGSGVTWCPESCTAPPPP